MLLAEEKKKRADSFFKPRSVQSAAVSESIDPAPSSAPAAVAASQAGAATKDTDKTPIYSQAEKVHPEILQIMGGGCGCLFLNLDRYISRTALVTNIIFSQIKFHLIVRKT